MNSNRRTFLKWGGGAASVITFSGAITKVLAATCGSTPPQTSGPFYPGDSEFQSDTDLTKIPGSQERALGQVIYVRGKVVDRFCKPVGEANVEIWQACSSGKYNNPKDPNSAPLDPHFRYWAETFTDAKGEYGFKTVLPGAYPAAADWTRPPHIHFRISRLGYRDLVTQMYFKGNQYNDGDHILRQIPSADRPAVIVDFQPSPEGFEPNSLTGIFDITLRVVRE